MRFQAYPPGRVNAAAAVTLAEGAVERDAKGESHTPEGMTMIGPYRFGTIKINDKDYHSDVIVYPDRVKDAWWRKEGHRLSLTDLEDVISEELDTLVVGTGYFGRMQIDPEVVEALKSRGIRLIAHRTGKACEEFNRLKETQKVIAALHLTC